MAIVPSTPLYGATVWTDGQAPAVDAAHLNNIENGVSKLNTDVRVIESIIDYAWVTPTLLNGFVQQTSDLNAFAYQRLANGGVKLKGAIKVGTTAMAAAGNRDIFTLPSDLWPATGVNPWCNARILTDISGGSSPNDLFLKVKATGAVNLNNPVTALPIGTMIVLNTVELLFT